MDIGIAEDARNEIVAALERVLADTYTLYLKTHNFHWNVTGPMFQTLHLLFEQQYTEQWQAVDLVAERIRTLGFPAPATYKAFSKLSSIEETEGVPAAEDMIKLLVQANDAVTRTARSITGIVGEAADEVTADLLVQRMQIHEKNSWMLRSLLA